MELKEWVHTPYHGKQYADSTLRGMKKEELIQIIRYCEHNYRGLYWMYENSVRASENIFRRLRQLKLLRRITDRDTEGNAIIRRDIGWTDALRRLALLEDIVEEWDKEVDDK